MAAIPDTQPVLTWASIREQAAAFITTEYASLDRSGAPITWPVTPYLGRDGRTIDVATGLTYPLKAERARRNPKVALSFSQPLGSGLTEPATFVIHGLATVRDADLRANSARYLAEVAARLPEAFDSIPTAMLRRMAWYWARIWVEVTPVRVLWWPGGDLDQPPQLWQPQTPPHSAAVGSRAGRSRRRIVEHPRPGGLACAGTRCARPARHAGADQRHSQRLAAAAARAGRRADPQRLPDAPTRWHRPGRRPGLPDVPYTWASLRKPGKHHRDWPLPQRRRVRRVRRGACAQ
jgi:hypothetical protein